VRTLWTAEHAVTAWALALGGDHAVVTDHPAGAEPWTHYCAEGTADTLRLRVVICHIHPAPAAPA
jgi:hypothetical protein